MTEWKLFDGDVPHVSTAEFHAHRERAPHLEQPEHRARLLATAELVRKAAAPMSTFCDLGCGDGGLLSLVQDNFADAWGYDFAPANEPAWAERGVDAELADVFNNPGRDWDVDLGRVVAVTEVLEHLADPHGVLRWLAGSEDVRTLVCSSPHNEDHRSHDECHAWAWDTAGYVKLVEDAGFKVLEQRLEGRFQLIRAEVA